MTSKSKIFYKEAKRSYDFSIDLLKSYDQRINNIYIMSTASATILILIAGFFYSIISPLNIQLQSISGILLLIAIILFLVSLANFITVLRKAFNVIKKKKIYSIDSEKIYNDFKPKNKTEEELLEQLIVQINSHYKSNIKVLKEIWTDYEQAADNLNKGILTLLLFFITAIYLSFSLIMGI